MGSNVTAIDLRAGRVRWTARFDDVDVTEGTVHGGLYVGVATVASRLGASDGSVR